MSVMTAKEAFRKKFQATISHCNTCAKHIPDLMGPGVCDCPGLHEHPLMFCSYQCYDVHVGRFHNVFRFSSNVRLFNGTLPLRRHPLLVPTVCGLCTTKTYYSENHMHIVHGLMQCVACRLTFDEISQTTRFSCTDGCADGPFCDEACLRRHLQRDCLKIVPPLPHVAAPANQSPEQPLAAIVLAPAVAAPHAVENPGPAPMDLAADEPASSSPPPPPPPLPPAPLPTGRMATRSPSKRKRPLRFRD